METKELTDEIEDYLTCTETSSSILNYWESKSRIWPKLSAISKVILAVPATETSSERVFSIAGRTLEERRTQLSEENVDDLLFVHGLKFKQFK